MLRGVGIPDPIRSAVEGALGHAVRTVQPVSGGDISSAARLSMEDGRKYFLKWGAVLSGGFEGSASLSATNASLYELESAGLRLLRIKLAEIGQEHRLYVPEPLMNGSDFLLMEWLDEGERRPESSTSFGRGLALLHSLGQNGPHSAHSPGRDFGLDHDNVIGRLPQSNRPWKTWGAFYLQERILPQLRLNNSRGNAALLHWLDRLEERAHWAETHLDEIFPPEAPSMLHGDLWGGNYMTMRDGTTALIDPAVYWGHREMDLAMTRLFGGFDPEFYTGYEEVWPLAPGAAQRASLCQLYPILVHANLFGGSYVGRADAILNEWFK